MSLYKPLPSQLKQLYISDKMKHLNYKGGCDIIMCIEVLKRTAGWLGVQMYSFGLLVM